MALDRNPSDAVTANWQGYYPADTSPSPGRFYVLTDYRSATTPVSGGDVDGVTFTLDAGGGPEPRLAPASKGVPLAVEAGSGGLSDGDDVATDGNGRAVVAGAGDTVVGRCFEGASQGQIAGVVFT